MEPVSFKVPKLTSWTRYERMLWTLLTFAFGHWRIVASASASLLGVSIASLGVKSVVWYGFRMCGFVAICVPSVTWTSLLLAWFPKPSGPHHVGSCDVEVPVQDDADSKHAVVRRFCARIYYPAGSHGGSREHWLPHPSSAYIKALGSVYGVPATLSYLLLFPARFILQRTLRNAEVAPARWPVALFSHGLCGMRSMYSTLCTELASQGYIVIAPEHTDGSACLAVCNGNLLNYVSRKEAKQRNRIQHRIDELRACWNSLAFIADGKFAESSDTSACVLLGHSFGASTVLCAASSEPFLNRSKLVILDPWISPIADVWDPVPAPTLAVMTGSMLWEPNASEVVHVLAELDTPAQPAFLTELIDARHQDVSDVPFFLHVPMALISASSQKISGCSVWKTYAELMRRFLQFDKCSKACESEASQLCKLSEVPGARVHRWRDWVQESTVKARL